MNCVNIKSRDFIYLAKRLNLSSNTLELIIHKYQAETGFDTAFPSDVYIQAQLGKDQYIEPSKAVRDLWEASYSTPQSFNSLQEYQRKYEEVKNYFPNEALVHYKDNENKDVLAVKKPVKELRPTINDYLESNSHTKQEWDDYDFITRQLAANLKNNNNFAAANKIREQYVTDRKTEEGNTTFSHFDLKKPIKLKEKGIAADLKAIQANEWHLPEDIQKTVADKLQKYMDDKSGEIQEVDTVPYFGEKGKTNAKDILTYITKNSTDKDIRTLASFVLKNLGKNENVPVSFSNNTRGFRGKYYTISHSVRINKISMTGNDVASAANNMEQTIIHEIAHAISVRAIETSPEIRKELLQIFKDYNQLKNQYGINTGYAAKNPKEFLAEFLGRKAFREALMALPSIGQENKKTKQTIGQRILNWLKSVLHIGNKSSFFKQADEVIQKVLDQANSQEFFYTDEMETAAEDRNPQPFTFNDGTVITAPFAPNRQQADALNAMNDFLNSNETTMTLSGYAGTGKTSLMEIIAQKARRQHKDIVFSATTNKAAAVLKSRVTKAGFDAQTLNKVFGINVEVDSSKVYNARNLVTALKEANVEPGTTVVIDEASMINEENYSILNRVARENSLKIIYVGDKAQLAPVNENQVSKVFRNSEGRIIELTKVERTDDNAILKEATNIRNGLPLSGESSFNERGEGVGYLTPKSREEVGRVIRHYIQGLKDNPNFFRILAYTNKAVTDYNNYVRGLLGYNDYVPHVGEPLTGYENWGRDRYTGTYRFINSESYKVKQVGQPAQTQISIDGTTYTMQYIPITMENSLGETDTFNYMDIKGNQENLRVAKILAKQKSLLWDRWRKTASREAKADIIAQINAIEQFLFVNDNIEDETIALKNGKHPLLQKKVVDFGYALTIHKSQGSTFTHVLMDDIDVAKAGNTLNNAANAEDVYIGEDQWGASMDNMQGEAEEVDMGITEYDLNPAKYANPTTTNNNNPNIANVRQQLEYVGVSRATNTVTIVASDANVKKEDSPLNHVKTTPTTKLSTKTIDKRFKFKTTKGFENMLEGGTFKIAEENLGRADGKGNGYYVKLSDNKIGNPTVYATFSGVDYLYTIDNNGNLKYKFEEDKVNKDPYHDAYPEKVQALNNIKDILQKAVLAKQGVEIYEDGTTSEDTSAVSQPVAIENTPKPADQMSKKELWEHLESLTEPIGERPVSYTPVGKTRQEYIVKDGKVYNKKGEEVHYQGKDMNKILANLAVAEDRGVVVTYRNNDYVVDNHQNITSVQTGDIMKWGPQDGNRNTIIQLAEQKFQTLIKNRQNRLSEMVPELMDLLKAQGINVNDKAAMEKSIKENPQWSTKIQQIIEENREMQSIKERAIADGTFMKAPNGNPTNLTERQWLQVRTKNFINWFGDWVNDPANASKVVDENGEPLVVYRGDSDGKTQFNSTKPSYNVQGIYIAGNKTFASNFVKPSFYNNFTEGTLYAVFVNAKNPIYNSRDIEGWNNGKYNTNDSWIYGNFPDGNGELVVRNSNQIKSVENNGMFSTENDDIQALQTSEGELYGFADPKGGLYFDEDNVSPNVQIHEYTHLWDRAVAQRNPKLWKRGVDLMKQTSLWNEVLNDANYGQKWQAVKGITSEKMESLIASEVHSRLTGTQGEALLNRIAKEKGSKGIIAKLKQWMLDFWKELKGTFSNWSNEEINNLTLDDFNKMTVRDLVDKVNLKEEQSNQQTLTITPAQAVDKKATAKGRISNKFIGFADGINGSSTAEYAKQAGDKANVGNYSPADTVFVSIPGMRGSAEVRHTQQDRTIQEALKALNQGATLITDNEAYTNSSSYNEGEKKLAQALKNAGAVYSERTVDGQTLGVWKLQQSAQQQTLPESDTKINIYAGTGENADLSNFAIRPFAHKLRSGGYKDFQSVEQAFQYIKANQFADTRANDGIARGGKSIETEIMETTNGAKLRQLGKSVKELNVQAWDRASSAVMKELLKESFEQNPRALQRLLATGNATLTHTQDKGKWGTEFPRLLMEVREELREHQPAQQQNTKEIGNYIIDYNTKTVHHKYISTESYKVQDLPRIERLKSVLERAGEQGGEHRIKYYQFKKIDELITKATEERGDYREKATTSLLYKIYGEDLTGVYDYDNSSKELIVNNWVFDLLQVAQESPKEIAGLVDFITDKYDKESTGIEVAIQDYSDIITGINSIKNSQQSVQQFTQQSQQQNVPASYEGDNAFNVTNQQVPISEVSPSEQSPQRVSLLSYEYFMDKTEDTLVDAAWKVPMLQELDKQISTELTPEENNDILDRMTRILEAKNQEDLLNLLSDEPKTNEKVEQNLTEFEKMTQQINNLLDSNIISASEIRHVAELVVNSISDTITILQKEEGAAEKFFPNIQTDLDFKSASRKEIVEAIGINNLIHRAKQQFDPEQNDYEDFDTMEQADLIIDNWDAIMTLAADTFSMNEGFGIMRNYDKGGFATTQNSTVDFDNFNDYSNDPDAMAESEKDEQEHWQVEQRTIDVLSSMSQMVRLALHECYQMNKEDNKVMSKWGIAERINPRKAVNSILRWTQGSLTLEDMISKMQGKATQNPWLNQLIERLSDKSGNETDFQSQFFGVFSKHFQPYSVVLLEDGKYHSIPVNSHPALSEAMQTITTQYKIGEHPLFTDRGINRKLLGSDSTTNAKAPFNLHQALAALNLIQDRLQHGEQLDNDMSKEAAANIMGVCRVMGYPITEEMLSDVINEDNLYKMTKSLGFIVESLDAAREEQFRNAGTPNAKVYNPFAFKSENGIAGSLRNFLTPITDTLEDTAVSAFYDSGKMYQSYVTPSFMTKLMNKFRLEGKEFEDFIVQEYGGTEWFKSAKNQWDVSKGWRNEWLRLLATDENARKVFDHKVELNFNKHNYMRNMSDAEYTLSLITEYFAETGQKKEALVPAWFRVPIMSNKPSSEFIKFYSYRGANYKDEIIYGLHQMFNQELSRIQTVNMRNRSKGDADFIANFDTNGRKFNFLPFLNRYLDANETSNLGLLLKKKINSQEALTAEEEARLSTMVDQAIRQDMENRVATILNQWEKSGIIETAKSIEGIGTEEAQIRANLENFLWNDNFASKNILQLTITDIAFYKDAEDLQKRLAQIHAPGIRGNVTATDYKGDRVSDGKYRTVLIQGLQKFKTDLIANIAEVFERKIAAAPEGQKAQLRALKESLVGEKGRYTKIDVTDGQAYSSPSSYRKKAFIFGKWSKHAEDIYQKLLKGDYNYSDLEVAFQPLKPFVYTHLQKNMGVNSAPIHQIPVPFQAKNSEYLLIMADALIKGEEAKSGKLSRPNILGVIYRIMEESEAQNPTKGIDTVQFDSAIKSGLQAPIDLNPFLDMEGGEEAAYEYMKRMIYKLDGQGNPSNEYATDTYVHEGLYEDYCLQQEVPEHFKNHSQAHGSQIRMIIPSDLDFYKNPNADHNDPNNQVFYEWTEPNGTKKKLRADEFRREYEQTIADNIRESIDQLSQELYINSENKKERNIALSKILQREILSSPRYGIDLIQACSIDKETGEFRIPKGDPIQAKRIEQLINSIIKNRVNKQKIAGGPIVQVTNFGASRQLHIRFNSKEGGLLMTREEYEKNPQKKEMSQTDKFNTRYGRKTASGNMTYEEYVKQNQAGIAYFEVFIPMWANEIFEKFSNEDGSINMKALEATDPELLKMISYRIPTEDKYSCAPMKAVGFMPREAGDAIMFPYELTEIDDSDFDVDKRYVMRKDIPIVRKPKHIIHKELFDIVEESYKKQHDGKELPANIASEIEVFLDSPDTMRSKSTFTKWLYSQYQKVAYTTKAPTSGRKYRDNKIVDMTWAVLTNEMTADKILNPGGFDVFKRAGYMVAAYKNPANNYSWGQLQQMSIDELNNLSYTDKDLTWIDTQIQFYKQNAAASSLIGVFAVNKVAHATLESNDYYIAVNEICGDEPFIIAGTEFDGRMKIDPSHDSEGNLIGKTIGAGVSASADAAKTPVLNLMNINMTTAGIFNTLLRLGMAPNDASLFMSQEVIERILNEFNRENLTNYKPLSTIIGEHISDLRDKYKITDSSNINTEPLSREELVEGLTPEEHEVIDYKVLLAFQKIRSLVDAIRKPTFATRFNSISSAVGPLILDNLIMEHKMEQFRDVASENGTHIYDSKGNNVDIDDIFYDHPILREFSRTVDIAKVMFSDMPAGSTGFRELLATLPEGLVDKVYNDKKLLDNLSNFYQSYLLIASHMVNPANLKRFIDGFPKYFNDQKFKEKYADNALIQAIRMNVSKRTDRPFLSINITGIDESQKEVYRSAWIDLHKNNPELSKQLFEYCFFRAGVGFNPKTFMSLVPTYVKERLSRDLGNGSQATYVDTYRRFPSVNPNVVLDQWVRNNWDNNKLVPKKGGEGTHYIVDLKRGTLVAKDPKDMADLQDCTYIKTRHNGQTYLWKQIIADETAVNYVMVKPLGNNAEYLEMSLSDITKPMSETKETIEDVQESELQTVSPAEADAAETSTANNITDTEKAKQVSEFADLLMQQNPKFNKTQAMNQIERMKEKPDLYAGFLVNVYKQKGLNLTKEEALAEFKKLC